MDDVRNVLTEEYLAELYNAAFESDCLCGIVVQYMKNEYLPDKHYQTLNNSLRSHYNTYNAAPTYAVIRQTLSSSRSMLELLDEIKDYAKGADESALREQFENYLKLAQFKKSYKEIGEKFKSGDGLRAIQMFLQSARELEEFSLAPDKFIDVADTFESRARDNKKKRETSSNQKSVTRFYIDELDNRNKGRNLRGQLSVFLAMSGVGKSHLARHIGKCAAYDDGLDVLHLQLEGSEAEALDAYSASLVGMQTYEYECGTVNDHTIESFRKQMIKYAGTLKVKAYPAFGKEISTIDIRNDAENYKKKYGRYPSVLIVDSLDLLTDSSGRVWGPKDTRHKRIAVAQDLKRIAQDLNCWLVATYQATIEDQEWVNNEKNVLNGYNLSEAKGLQRPCTHLISLNQSSREEKEQTMRIYVAKSRFFPKGQAFRICTDYAHECFYDRQRTLNLPAA